MFRGLTFAVAALALGLAAGPARAEATPDFSFEEFVSGAVKKSVPFLQTSGKTFLTNASHDCFSCHHQALPMMAASLAQGRGFQVDAAIERDQLARIAGLLTATGDLARQSLKDPAAEKKLDSMLVDPTVSAGYALWALGETRYAPNANTGAYALYLMKKQKEDGHWAVPFARPPMEGSEFTGTALAVYAMKTYAPKEAEREVAERASRTREWLLTAKPKTTEDKTFRLYGLQWTGASPEEIGKAVRALADEQHDDGGWGQRPGMASDAYATGQVLVALHRAGDLPVMDAIYTRGAGFLLGTQKEDGSWLVEKRTPAFQQPFDTGFPHGNSQFISCAASGWATMALTYLVPPAQTVASGETAGPAAR